MLEALRCRFCTGFINPRTYTCEYCGTVYMRPREPFKMDSKELVVVTEAPVFTYRAGCAIDTRFRDCEWVTKECIDNHVKENIAKELIKNIVPNLHITKLDDPYQQQTIYTADLRIVKPNYKWGT